MAWIPPNVKMKLVQWILRISAVTIAVMLLVYKITVILSHPELFLEEQLMTHTRTFYPLQARLTTRVSCIITLFRIMIYDIASSLSSATCNVFYDSIVDPITAAKIDWMFDEPRHRSHTPRGSGIPGRHGSRRASTHTRARPPPFRVSCVRRRNKNSIKRNVRHNCRRHNTIPSVPDDPICRKVQQWIFDSVANDSLVSSFQRRSETHARWRGNDTKGEPRSEPRSGNNTTFTGEYRSGNNSHNTYFSAPVYRLINQVHLSAPGKQRTKFLDCLVGDSGAGCSVISNRTMLTNIRKAPGNKLMRIHCNSGVVETNRIGDLAGYGVVWYNPKGIANILSLGEASRKHRITMDSSIDNAIYLHLADDTMQRFECIDSGVYCYNLRRSNAHVFSSIISVKDQEQQYSALDVGRAKAARKLQEVMGFISEMDLLHVIDHNLIRDSKVRRRDVLMAKDIYGSNTSVLKGKTTRRTEEQVREDALMDVPQYILDRYSKNVAICADVMYVNGIPFFIAISKHIKHISVVSSKSMNKETMLSCIDKVIKAYGHRGFTITKMHMDNAFECLRGDLQGPRRNIDLNTVAANEHEPNIERCIRHVKERVRCTSAAIQFPRLPRRLTVALVDSTIYWINCAPRRDGVHPVLSPRTIMTGQQLTSKNVEFQFGDFVQATQPPRTPNSGNSMDERTSDAIYCFPSGNTQGGFWVYKLSTNQVVHRNRAKLAHSNDIVAKQVEAIAANENAPDGLTFGDRTGAATILDFETEAMEFDDDLSDDEYQNDPDDELEDDHDIDDGEYHDAVETDDIVDDIVEDIVDDDVVEIEDLDDGMDIENAPHDGNNVNNNTGADEDDQVFVDDESIAGDEVEDDENLGVGTDDGTPTNNEDDATNTRRSSRVVLEPTRYPETERVVHNHVYFQAVDQYQNIDATMSSKQYGLSAGLKRFEDKGRDL